MDRLRTIEVFQQVARLGSFSRAAEALDLPPSSVTAAVQELERRVGTKLLQRTTRRVSLTPAGSAYLDASTRLVDELTRLETAVGGTLARGTVRVALSGGLARGIVAPALPDLLGSQPDLVVELWPVRPGMRPGDEGPDCVLTTEDVHDEAWSTRRLGAWPTVTVAAPAWLAQHGRPKALADLERHRFVTVLTGGVPEPVRFTQDDTPQALHVGHRVAAADPDTALALALAGLGLLQAPADRNLRAHLDRGHLERVLPEVSSGSATLYAVYPKGGVALQRIRIVVDWLSELLSRECAAAWQGPSTARPRRPSF